MSEQISAGEVPVDETTIQPRPGVGAQLRAAREAGGIQLEEVASALKLGPRQVEALENNDWQALPGNTFIRGFVRNYARLMQLDQIQLMADLDSVLEKPVTTLRGDDANSATMPQSGNAISHRDRSVVVAGATLVLLAGLAYFLMPNDLSAIRGDVQGWIDSLSRKEAPAPKSEPVAEPVFPPGSTPQQVMNPQVESQAPAALEQAAPGSAPATAAPPAVAADVAPAPAGSVPLRFYFDKESWLEVRDRDGKAIFSQRVAAGTEQTLSGQGPLSLVIGYAPGVRVMLRGQAVDLAPHSRGDVARLVLE